MNVDVEDDFDLNLGRGLDFSTNLWIASEWKFIEFEAMTKWNRDESESENHSTWKLFCCLYVQIKSSNWVCVFSKVTTWPSFCILVALRPSLPSKGIAICNLERRLDTFIANYTKSTRWMSILVRTGLSKNNVSFSLTVQPLPVTDTFIALRYSIPHSVFFAFKCLRHTLIHIF